MRALQPGTLESLKREWHRGMLVLSAGALLYNGAAWLYRTAQSARDREPPEDAARRHEHLALNVFLYLLNVAVERVHVRSHTPGHEPRADLPGLLRRPPD